jgi:chromosome segregation ATPase
VNAETLLWIGGLAIEALVVAAVVLGIMLRRSQNARQQLLAQRETKAAPAAETAVAVEARPAAEPTVAIEIAESDWIDGDKDAATPAQLDASTGRLQQRLEVTNESLQRLEAGLQQGAAHPEMATLKDNLQGMTSEIDSLQQNSAKLRSDMTTLRDKLRHSEIDVQKLQAEKDALAAEYAALSQEYERVYANSDKSGA